MSYETCEHCGESGETDHDMGEWVREKFGPVRYMCAACWGKAVKADRDPPGDWVEEDAIAKRSRT